MNAPELGAQLVAASRTWEKPHALPFGGSAGISAWSPDGRSVSFNGDSGIRVIDFATGRQRLAAVEPGSAWSADGRTIYQTDGSTSR